MSDEPLPLPAFTSWPTFPFEGELRVKQLADPVEVEPPRHGEDPAECTACRGPDTAYIWVSERWRVRALDRPTGLPAVLILESRSHLDMGDLPNLLAAELGVLTVRLERAIRSLDGVARVHVNRWGDGSAHLHVWFLARPTGRLQLRGTFLSLWDDILPRIPETQWRENLALVAAWLADFGGTALAEPPHIDWQAPAELTIPTAAEMVADEPAADGDTTVLPGGADPADHATGVLTDTVALPVGTGSPTDGVTTVVPTQSDGRTEDGTETVKLATAGRNGDRTVRLGAGRRGRKTNGRDDAAAAASADGTGSVDADDPTAAASSADAAVGDTAADHETGRSAGSETVRIVTRATSAGGETINLSEVGSGATIRFPTTAGAAGGAESGSPTIVFPTGQTGDAPPAEESTEPGGPDASPADPQREAGGDAIASGITTKR